MASSSSSSSSFATKRLMKDLEQLHRHPIPGVFAQPLEGNLLEWHVNLAKHPDGDLLGSYGHDCGGVVLHLILRFPDTYPTAPPSVQVCTDFPHPNIIPTSGGRFMVCLEMLELPRQDSPPYRHWSSAFTVSSLLTQLRSFILHEGQVVLLSNHRATVDQAIDHALGFSCQACGHGPNHPHPGLHHDHHHAPPPSKKAVSAHILKSLHARRQLEAQRRVHQQPPPPAQSRPVQPHASGVESSLVTTASSQSPSAAGDGGEWHHIPVKHHHKGTTAPASSSGASQGGGGGGGAISTDGQQHNYYSLLLAPLPPPPRVRCAECSRKLEARCYSNSQLKKDSPRCAACVQRGEEEKLGAPQPPKPPASLSSAMPIKPCQPSSTGMGVKKAAKPITAASSSLGKENQPPAAGTGGGEEKGEEGGWEVVSGGRKVAPPKAAPVAPLPCKDQTTAGQQPDGDSSSRSAWLSLNHAAGRLAGVPHTTMMQILEFLEAPDVASFAGACRYSCAVADAGFLWRELFLRQYKHSQLTAASMLDWRYLFSLERNQVAEEPHCWFTKASHEEDVLGIPLEYTVNPVKHTIDHIYSSMDLLSLSAYREHGVRRTPWNEVFTAWLPLYLTADHFDRALPHLRQAIAQLCPGKPPFTPSLCLGVLPKLMCTMIVLIVDRGLSNSERALEGYCQLHRLFLALVERYPSLGRMVEERIGAFLRSEEGRSKSALPSLGDLLPMLSVSKKYRWRHVALAYFKEGLARGTLWACKEHPELASFNVRARDRLSKTWGATVISHRLLLFHAYFLNYVAHPPGLDLGDVLHRHDLYLGRPALATRVHFHRAVSKILTASSWPEFFHYSYMACPSQAQMVRLLEDSVRLSLKKGYHSATTRFDQIQRSGVSKVLLKGGEKYSVAPNLRRVVMRDEWRYHGHHMRYLDATCLVYGFDGSQLGYVDYSSRQAFGGALSHSGDVIDQQISRGQHEIQIDLARLPSEAKSLFFTLSAWHSKLTSIIHPSVTLQDAEHGQGELVSYELEDKPKKDFTAVLMCQLTRAQAGGSWKVRAIGQLGYGCAGNYGPMQDDIKKLLAQAVQM